MCVCTDADGCISLTMPVDVCQCCRLLMFVFLPLFESLSLLLNLVNKQSESESRSGRPGLPFQTKQNKNDFCGRKTARKKKKNLARTREDRRDSQPPPEQQMLTPSLP